MNYEITVKAVATVFVADAKSEDEAYSLAREAMSCGDFEDIEMEAAELKTPEESRRSRAHCQAWSAP